MTGRVSKFSGKTLTPSPEVANANPRKAGSHGWHSLEIVRSNPGLTWEAFKEAGGRGNDLDWDISKGNVIAT